MILAILMILVSQIVHCPDGTPVDMGAALKDGRCHVDEVLAPTPTPLPSGCGHLSCESWACCGIGDGNYCPCEDFRPPSTPTPVPIGTPLNNINGKLEEIIKLLRELK